MWKVHDAGMSASSKLGLGYMRTAWRQNGINDTLSAFPSADSEAVASKAKLQRLGHREG